MSFLEKIRKNTWILFLFIGIFLISFILDPNILIKLFIKDYNNIIGKVNGENISIKEYINTFQFLKRFNQSDSDVDLKNKAWKLLINEKLLNQQALKLGLESTKKDFWNAISKQSIYSYVLDFQDNNGFFDLNKFKIYLKNLEKKLQYNNSQIEDEKNIWLYEKNNIPKRILSQKYIEMLMYGLNTSLVEAELNFKNKNYNTIIDYIFIPYSEIEKKYNLLKINYFDIKNYIHKHKFLFHKENLRNLSFVIIRSKPSLNDKKNMKKKMSILFNKLKNTHNDYDLVENYSEKSFDSHYYFKKDLPVFLQNFVIKNNNIGNILGPIEKDNIYIIAKIIGKKKISESVLSSHILISHKDAIRTSNHRTKKEAEKIAKKLYKFIKKNPDKFNSLVKEKSEDIINAKNHKGNLGWLRYEDQKYIGPFNIFNSEKKQGMIQLTETKFGYHIVRIDKKSPPNTAYKFAVIIKTLNTSNKTENFINKNVKNFLLEIKNYTINTFINQARKKKYETLYLRTINNNQWKIDGLNTDVDKEIINWSFEKKRKEGDSNVFYSSNKDSIIVYLSKIKQRGFNIEKIKNDIIPLIRRKKIEKILSYKKFNFEKLEKIANFFSKKIEKNYKINFYNSIINHDKEPKIVGFASSFKTEKTSKPLLGKKGIFFIKVLKHSSYTKKPSYLFYEIETLNTFLRKNILELVGKVLINKSRIEDYRNIKKF
ncbi:peptidylprolyl isomerase [Blattabacterium cuenoti]|uniref:peptidylprolyl isomerase n=1 Tax=Blattabacterium cuenoti TaxID=1653831 RepID=UPI00163C0473|nr:peptidylprolyl isomerase [Blattabacterium cuenoti]